MSSPTSVPLLTQPPVSEAQVSALDRSRTSQQGELREVFDQFVGETFFGQLLKAMRQTVHEPAYFHGGRGEKVFQAQLDQVLAAKMSEVGRALSIALDIE